MINASGSGVVINVASHFGDRTVPKSALYTASKCAIIGLTRAASVEAAPFGIRVHAVGPEYDADAITARVAGSPDNHSAAANSISHDRPTTTGKVDTYRAPRRHPGHLIMYSMTATCRDSTSTTSPSVSGCE